LYHNKIINVAFMHIWKAFHTEVVTHVFKTEAIHSSSLLPMAGI
jgi:hypothetical protein